jgi:hypothetical protein
VTDFFDGMTVGETIKMAGLTVTYDTAVPQTWFDAHQAEIKEHGGWVIWVYPEGNLFGQPMFGDEVMRLAMEAELRARERAVGEWEKVAKHLAKALHDARFNFFQRETLSEVELLRQARESVELHGF